MNKWSPPRNSGGIPYVSTRFSMGMEMSRLTRYGTAEPVSRDQIPRRKRGQGNINFPCSADHEQDWQPYPDDPYSCYMRDHTIHTTQERSTGNKPAGSLGITRNPIVKIPPPSPTVNLFLILSMIHDMM